jgi:DNA processing protein
MDRQSACTVLARAPTLRAHHLRALVAAANGELADCLAPEILSRAQIPPAARYHLLNPDPTQLAADLRWIESSGVRLLASTDPHYPQQLLQLPDAPAVLFVLGDPQTLHTSQLAMVGARCATEVGRRTAWRYAEYFAKAGLTITSGLALGIDAASHEGALRGGGATIAVCATGLDIIYPTRHRALASLIRGSGALISEFPRGTPPQRCNFPQRNRLISGLSLGTLVVEAALQSGSLITARRALHLRRAVFAIPGCVSNGLSRGCHQLIREGATLVEEPSQVLARLEIPEPNKGVTGRHSPPGRAGAMDKGYEMLLDALGFEPATVDILALRTGLPGESIASMLLTLELEGRIAPYPGGRVGRIPC